MRNLIMIKKHIKIMILATILFAVSSAGFAETIDSITISNSLRGDGTVTLFRPAKNERHTFTYRNEDGSYNTAAMNDIAYFFRCRMTNKVHPIDSELIEIIDSIEDHFKAKEVKLVSAYRSPARNSAMRRSGRRVATKSLHMFGRAADIEISGIGAKKIRDYVYALKQGGVGYYGSKRFVHIDTGPLRTWGWNPNTSRKLTASANK